ncbi:MAG: FIG003003: hypothetical protein [uncultured Truepera sp.]|uniref:DUF72 domain-containing protein n=1 Tax=uncultured Truepera sp. TaxID=543023 RepID=A0A6J4UQ19_9DEIN|nr:MAG: FIG003003: hypothetical protein [uncultured Truepera sp.]
MELYLGTGGYTNDDWRGILYPEDAKSSAYLELYAEHFNAVELNSSFYNIPGTKAFAGMVKKSGSRVRFAVKLHSSMTHSRDADAELFKRLFESVAPLREAGMLGPFLAQFPYSFHRTPENRLYLKTLTDRFAEAGEALAVEFRTAEWHVPEVYDALTEAGLVAVSVDYPPLPNMPKPDLLLGTATAYIRLHGRNERTWYGGKSAAERHDYLYSKDELSPWVRSVVEAELEQCYLIFLNTTKGHALKNLKMIGELFAEAGVNAPMSL